MSQHLPLLAIATPLVFAALLLWLERCGIAAQRAVAWLGMAILLVIAVQLVRIADDGLINVYLVGDWPARLGISLVLDRLSALMVLTTTLLAMAALLHACAGWDRRAMHFHALFQVQLMGLNGAFLTGDLFNLFVFFEVLLASSYGLLLSGGRGGRVRVGFHYVAFNISASTLFLIALGLIYGLLGSLNMAELAVRVGELGARDRVLLQAIAGLLMVVFCAKAAILPLYLWLPGTYGRAPPAVAALFVIMTKVGLYAILRTNTLIFGDSAGDLAGFAWQWLLPGGVVTLMLAAFGVLAAVRLRILSGYLVLASAATLFIAFSLATPAALGAGLYYLAHSCFIGGALYLITELVRRHRVTDRMNVTLPMPDRALPGTFFIIAAIGAIGLPPLSGFIGKFTLLAAVPEQHLGLLWSVILVSSFVIMVAMARAGARLFWQVTPDDDGASQQNGKSRRGRRREIAATALLLAYGIAMTVWAGPVLRYTNAAGEQLLQSGQYIQAARDQKPLIREP